MRDISISIDLFAELWALREPQEQSENDIIGRILKDYVEMKSPPGAPNAVEAPADLQNQTRTAPNRKVRAPKEGNSSKRARKLGGLEPEQQVGKIRWVDDIRAALLILGGSATLHEIYKEVRVQRQEANRSVPRTLEATVRRTLEDHSSDSANFRAADLFKKVRRGEWALRSPSASEA